MNDHENQTYEFNAFRVDTAKRLLLTASGDPIPLTPKVFDTLLYLVRHSGKVIEKDELMREIWADSIVEENNLNQNISILRRAFGERPGEHRFIVTVAGRGYRFVPDVTSISEPAPGITDLEAAVVTLKNRKAEADVSEMHVPRFKTRDRRWAFVFGVLSVLAVGIAGFYVWRQKVVGLDLPVKTLAVLPFKPLVLENRHEELEIGLADALISKLSGSEAIVVRPLSAIRRYNSVEQDSLTAATELGVESVLDGTIQTWGDRIRISAKLLRASDGRQLWAGQFDEKFNDIFAVQDSISEKVAGALKVRLAGKRRPTEDLEAYQLFMKGRYHIAKGTPPDLIASIRFFEQAIELDPGYALAYTGLSNAYGVLGLAGDTSIPDAVLKGRAAEQKALEIDDTLGEAHITNCMGLFWYDWNWLAAEKACARAIAIDPNNAEFHGHFAGVLSNMGRHSEALAEAKRSRELNPLDLAQLALEGQYLLNAGQVDEAIASLRKTSELEPNFWMTYFFAANAYIEKGMFEEAVTASQKELQLSGKNVLPLGAVALAKAGKHGEARVTLKALTELSGENYVSPYGVALLFAALDEPDNAFDWLEKAFQQRDPLMAYLKVDPKWKSLRNEPRFVELMRRMNFD